MKSTTAPPGKLIHWLRAQRWECVLIGTATALYAYFLPRNYVGCFKDDALYVIASHSLAQGRFASLCLPEQPPMSHFLPGYPLMLMPFVALSGPDGMMLKVSSMLSMLCGAMLLTWLARRFLSKGESLCVLGLFLFNPIVVGYSSAVMPEPFTIFLNLAVWLQVWNYSKKPSSQRLALLAVTLSWACMLRHESLLLAFAVAAAFLIARKTRAALWAVGPALGIRIAWYLRNYILTRTATDYLPSWKQDFESTAGWIQGLFSRASSLLDVLYFQSIAAITWSPDNPWREPVMWGCILCGLALTLYGANRLWKNHPEARASLAGIGLFLTSFLALHLFWYVRNPRYALPALPYLALALVAGIRGSWTNHRWTRPAVVFFVGIMLYGYADRLSYTLYKRATGTEAASSRLPSETLRWTQQHIPITTHVMSNWIETLYLRNGHKGYFLLPAANAQELHNTLRSHAVDYVVYKAAGALDTNLENRWTQAIEWAATHRKLFRIDYLNNAEQTVVFRVL